MSRRNAVSLLALLASVVSSTVARADAVFGPPAADNPYAADRGGSAQHGDSAASDTSPLPGPGRGHVIATSISLAAVCPSILIGAGDVPIAVCTKILDRAPSVYALDPLTGQPTATLAIVGGDLFGGVYPYLDQLGRVVIVDGKQTLLLLSRSADGTSIRIDSQVELASVITAPCGSASCDAVVGLSPGYDGLVWFASSRGVVGTVDLESGAIETLALPREERISNSIATAPEGTAVVSDHALYLLRSEAGKPVIRFRAPYDRGPARKPGQLSHGSGSTPTFFGPETGSEYVALLDNARPQLNLLVYRSSDGKVVCSEPVPLPAGSGSENSPIGSGRSVFVASTYGYPYPALPAEAGPSEPASANITGGMARLDVSADGTRCSPAWSIDVASAAVPKLSLVDGLIYTIARGTVLAPGMPSALDSYAYVAIDARTGALVANQQVARGVDTMQLAGTIARGGVIYQGTFGGLLRIAPSAPVPDVVYDAGPHSTPVDAGLADASVHADAARGEGPEDAGVTRDPGGSTGSRDAASPRTRRDAQAPAVSDDAARDSEAGCACQVAGTQHSLVDGLGALLLAALLLVRRRLAAR